MLNHTQYHTISRAKNCQNTVFGHLPLDIPPEIPPRRSLQTFPPGVRHSSAITGLGLPFPLCVSVGLLLGLKINDKMFLNHAVTIFSLSHMKLSELVHLLTDLRSLLFPLHHSTRSSSLSRLLSPLVFKIANKAFDHTSPV